MKKIPTLFKREFVNHTVVSISPEVVPELQWVLDGEGVATVKIDGACCAIINGDFYKRYDAKRGKPVPVGAIKCQEEADTVTGHLPCWLKCDRENPTDKWFWEAYDNAKPEIDGTYEAVGPAFQSNPEHIGHNTLVKHGIFVIDDCPRNFDGIKDFLRTHEIEGIVFWKDGEPKCKIKRKDFGFKWPVDHELDSTTRNFDIK